VLNPDYVTELRWWEHPDFAERYVLEAAELVAYDMLNPALRSRGQSGSNRLNSMTTKPSRTRCVPYCQVRQRDVWLS
jgi:hypothetical protein